MFEVVRWLGPGEDFSQNHGGALTVEELNARARQRANVRRGAARFNLATDKGAIASSNGQDRLGAESNDGVPSKTRKVKKRKKIDKPNGNVEDLNALRSAGENEPSKDKQEIAANDLVKAEKRKKKEKEKRERTEVLIEATEKLTEETETVVEIEELQSTVEILDKKERKKQKRRRSAPTEPDEDNNAEASGVPADAAGNELGGREVPNSEKKRKKTKTILLDSEAQIYAVENTGKQISNLEADVVAAVQTLKEKRKKKRKVVDADIEVPANDDETVHHLTLDGNAASPPRKFEKVPSDEVDIVRIERDVEKILGHDLLPRKNDVGAEGKGPAVLPWMRDPLVISTHKEVPLMEVPGLDIRLQDSLRKAGIEALFPVQVAVWHETIGPGRCERDLCVCSPTGSGKTLSYALPIVQKLSTRVIRRLRALVVLPTRDLALQVKAVFDTIAPAVGLKVGLAVGQTSIVAESAQLVNYREQMVHSFGGTKASDYGIAESCVDILVATPGRLMDHLRNTKEFTLEHLLYLVVDETDRLLRQSYQDWLPNVLTTVAATESRDNTSTPKGLILNDSFVRSVHTIRHMGAERGLRGCIYPRLMKMVLSATLTRDPSKIAQLALHSPMYIAQSALDNRYKLPEQLQSFKLVCKPGEKPLYLVALLQQLAGQQTIVFTASVVATHRLFMLLSFFEDLSFKVVEYSSLQHQQARSKALTKFREGKVQVLVASDAMTRGMDVEGVGNVVNYDMPVYAKTYVHRVGRTARAGRAGCSYTLLRREEVRHFKSLLKKADNSSCKDYGLPASAKVNLYDQYLTALEKLKQITKEESGSGRTPGSKDTNVQALEGEQGVSGADDLFMGNSLE